MNTLNNKYDEWIDGLMTSNAKENKDALHSELLNKIPLSDSYTNSISIAVGKQRSGKTYKIIKEIIKISKMHHETHMLLYINKTGGETDKTFESFKDLIKCPIVYCSQEECEDKLAELIEYKNMYHQIIAEGTNEGVDPDEEQTMFDVLDISDYSRPYLHTLVLLDDIANSPLLKKETSYLNSLMTQCAHINMSFYLAVQYWKGLPAALKSQTSMIYLFGGFNKQQVRYMLTQINLEDPFEDVWPKYMKLKNRDYMTIDTIAGSYKITIVNAKEEKPHVDTKIAKKAKKQMRGVEEEEVHEDLIAGPETENTESEPQWLANWGTAPPSEPSYLDTPSYRQPSYLDTPSYRQPSYLDTPKVRDTRKDLSPVKKINTIDIDWENIWNRNLEGRRDTSGW